MYYVYIGLSKFITTDLSQIEKVYKVYPYSKVRKFEEKEKALKYLNKEEVKDINNIRYIGFPSNRVSISIEVIPDFHKAYVNFFLSSSSILLDTDKLSIQKINQTTYTTTIHRTFYKKGNSLSYANALLTILNLIPSFVDINIVDNTMTTYCIKEVYKGSNSTILSLQNSLNNRKGNVIICRKDALKECQIKLIDI